jgi:uncharacterized membrane protein YbhN (UPF0104 family)
VTVRRSVADERSDSGAESRPSENGKGVLAFLTRLTRLRSSLRSPVMERLGLILALAIFAATTVVAYRGLPLHERAIHWPLLIFAAVVAVPAMIALNGVEYRLSARFLGHRVAFLQAARVGLIGTAANQLPIPGSALVRMRALNRLGSGYLRATASTAIVGLVWIGVTGLFAGGFILASGKVGLGAPLAGAGAIATVGGFLLLRSQVAPAERLGLIARLVAVEVAFVAVSGLRYFLVLRALGVRASVAQALALTVSAVLAAAAGFFPGGLGLRELLAAGMSPIVGLPAAVGAVATAVDRAVSLVVLSIAAATFLVLIPRLSQGKRLDREPGAAGKPVA